MSGERAVRVGVLGYGMSTRVFHAPLIHTTPGLELAAIASSRPEAVHERWPQVRVHPDPGALIADDIDLVVVATPNATHVPLAAEALAAGRHVVVEKPVGIDAPEVAQLRDVAATAPGVLAVFQNRRWDSDFRTVQQIVRSGEVGRVVEVLSRMDRFRPRVRDRWRESGGPGSGLLLDLGPHLVDQALHLFGPQEWVAADVDHLREGAHADDYVHVVLGSADGPRIVLHASLLAADPGPRFVVHGTRGSLVIGAGDGQEAALAAGRLPGPGWGSDAPPARLVTGEGERSVPAQTGDYREFYAGVREAIAGTAAVPVTIEESVQVARVLDAARLSAGSGRRLSLTD